MKTLATIPVSLDTMLTDAQAAYVLVSGFILSVVVFSVIMWVLNKINTRTGK